MKKTKIITLLVSSVLVLCILLTFFQASPGPRALANNPSAPDDHEICYTIADNADTAQEDALLRVEYETGINFVVGMTGTFAGESLTFQLETGTLFTASSGVLGALDTTTGVFTARPQPFGMGNNGTQNVGFRDVDGLAFDVNGDMYGIVRRDSLNDILFRIDPVSGAHIENAFGPDMDFLNVGVVNGYHDIDDIAIDPTSGVMYAIANSGGVGDHLVTIDKTTGAAVQIGSLTVNDMEGLTFDTTGQLLGTTGKDGATNTKNRIYRLDKASGVADLATAKLINAGGNFDFEGVDCLSSPVHTTSTPTPTSTATSTATQTSTPTPTVTGTIPATNTPTPTVTGTMGIITATPTFTPTPTSTPREPTAVELLYFRVFGSDGTQVDLSWATAAEIGTYGFNLYRSATPDFSQAQLIHFEAARGGVVETQYQFTDQTPTAGVWYYWLEEVLAGSGRVNSKVIASGYTGPKIFVPFVIVRHLR